MVLSEGADAEKQRPPISSPPMPSKQFPIYLHFDTWGDSHGLYYVIEERGDSPAPQYSRPHVETSNGEEDSEYVPPKLNLTRDKEVKVEDENEEDYQDPLKEAEEEARVEAFFHMRPDPFGSGSDPEEEAKAKAFFHSTPTYIPPAMSSADDSEEEAKAKAFFHSTPTYIPPAMSSDDDSEEEAKGFTFGRPLYYDVFDAEEEPPPKKSKVEQVEDETKEGEIFVMYNNEADTIRPLKFPDLAFIPFTSDLLLVGERFYFIGGYDVRKPLRSYKGDSSPMTDMLVWDSNIDKVWKSVPGPDVLSHSFLYLTQKAVVWAANTIFVIGNSFKRTAPTTIRALSAGDPAWKTVPLLPAIYISHILDMLPIAVNGLKIFFHVSGKYFLAKYRNRPVHLAAYFDAKTWQWEIVSKWFTGEWTPGVVLYDAYLFSYGTKNPSLDKKYIRAYSIEHRCWLSRPVRGLNKDGNVLPDESENVDGVTTYLLQVNDNVLAFVWSRMPTIRYKGEKDMCEVHCTKFRLDCIKDPKKKHPVFRAEVISYGRWLVEGHTLQNCLLKCRNF